MNTSLNHFHVTLTLPGELRTLLFEKRFSAHYLVAPGAGALRRHLRDSAGVAGPEWTNGMIGAAHPCGNGLNYNPHVHLVTTRELVNTKSGEIVDPPFILYSHVRAEWRDAVLRMLVRKGYLSQDEAGEYRGQYPGGSHVHFKPIKGNGNDTLFKTAEYLASGAFHNSQIREVNHAKKTIPFTFRRWIDRNAEGKLYATQTMPILDFKARLLFYLPERNKKQSATTAFTRMVSMKSSKRYEKKLGIRDRALLRDRHRCMPSLRGSHDRTGYIRL